MRRRTQPAVRRWRAGVHVPDWIDAAGTMSESRKATEQTAAAQRTREWTPYEDAARQTRLSQIDRLDAAWSPAIKNYLTMLGNSTWGVCQYEIVDDIDPDAYWREYQVRGLDWHERTDRYSVRNQDDWYQCEYRLGYRLHIEVTDDHYTLGHSPLTENSLKQWFLEVFEEGCPHCVEEHLVRIY